MIGETWGRRRGFSMKRMAWAGVFVGIAIVLVTWGYLYYRANSPGQLAARAQLALEQHDPQKAIELLKRALDRAPGGDLQVGLLDLMARALMEAGREEDARGYLAQALAQKPGHAESLDLRVQSYVNPAFRRLREAFKPVSDAKGKEILASVD